MEDYCTNIVFGLIALVAFALGCRIGFLSDPKARRKWMLAVAFVPVTLGVICGKILSVYVLKESQSDFPILVATVTFLGLLLAILLAAWGWAATYLIRYLFKGLRRTR
jgi:uncharacterized membrane protein YciS (DUF1049 family)